MPPRVSIPVMPAPTPEIAEETEKLPFSVPFRSTMTELEAVELTLASWSDAAAAQENVAGDLGALDQLESGRKSPWTMRDEVWAAVVAPVKVLSAVRVVRVTGP